MEVCEEAPTTLAQETPGTAPVDERDAGAFRKVRKFRRRRGSGSHRPDVIFLTKPSYLSYLI